MEHGYPFGAFCEALACILGISVPDWLGHYDYESLGIYWTLNWYIYTGYTDTLLKGDREKEPIPETLSDFTKVITKISKEVTDIQTHV